MPEQFEDVGTSRPVVMTQEQKRDLLRVNVDWAEEEGDYDRLPDGTGLTCRLHQESGDDRGPSHLLTRSSFSAIDRAAPKGGS